MFVRRRAHMKHDRPRRAVSDWAGHGDLKSREGGLLTAFGAVRIEGILAVQAEIRVEGQIHVAQGLLKRPLYRSIRSEC